MAGRVRPTNAITDDKKSRGRAPAFEKRERVPVIVFVSIVERQNGRAGGKVPDEVFFGIGDEVTKRLSEALESARKKRMKENRAAGCGVCVGVTTSGALLLQQPRSRIL